ncbi:MAG: hypothetical protein SCM11_12730 [Bacillota bacterium]|nr:hypothetical protein [Bacillota bacterium]
MNNSIKDNEDNEINESTNKKEENIMNENTENQNNEEIKENALQEGQEPAEILETKESVFQYRELSNTPDPYIVNLLAACQNRLFRDTQNKTYVIFPADNGVRIYGIETADFESYLTSDYFMYKGEAIKRQYLRQLTKLLDSLAKEYGKTVDLELRCNWDAGSIMYDLHDKDHHVVRINEQGWAIEYCKKPLFKTYPHQLPQVPPIDGRALDEFLALFNVSQEDRLLFKVFVVSLFIPGLPHPILKIEGEKGSAKSTATRLLKLLVDPSKVELLSFPRENREMVQQLDHHYYLAYDNLSSIPRWASDALCRAVSGDGYSCRK